MLEENLLPVTKWARSGKKLHRVEAVVVHWVAAPGQTPEQVRKFWAQREGSYGSGHYVVGNDGRVVQTIPDDEVAWHVGSSKGYTDLAKELFGHHYTSVSTPNWVTLGVELCHTNWEGEFRDECWEVAVNLVADLFKKYDLSDILRVVTHQQVVGWKQCPRWFVEHPDELDLFRRDVQALL